MLSISVSASTRNEYTLSTSDNARDGFPRGWSYDKAWLFDGGQPVSVAMQGGQLEQGVVWGEIQGHQPVHMIWVGWIPDAGSVKEKFGMNLPLTRQPFQTGGWQRGGVIRLLGLIRICKLIKI